MPKAVLNAFLFVFFAIASVAGQAQTIEAEQAELTKLQRQNENMASVADDLRARLSALNEEIEQIKQQPNPNDADVAAATAELDAANQAFATNPSATNKDKVEMAQFKQALAVRKQQKSNPNLSKLVKEQEELSRAVKTNEQKIAANTNTIAETEQRIVAMRAEAERKRQDWLRRQSEQRAAAEDQALERAKQEREEALAEVERLRNLLATKNAPVSEPEQKAEPKTATAVVQSTGQRYENDGLIYLFSPADIRTEINRIASISANSGSDTSKLMVVRTYDGDKVKSRRRVGLREVTKDIFQIDSTELPAADIALIIGREGWRFNLSEIDSSIAPDSKGNYWVTLDRTSRNPKLTLFKAQ